MNAKLTLLLLFLAAGMLDAAVTGGRLVYQNGTAATLYYDTGTSTYADGSIRNPNVFVELCAESAEDLLGNFTALYYRSGAINISISPAPVNITSVNASNCTKVDVDVSIFKGYYPAIVSVGFGTGPAMAGPTFFDLAPDDGLLSGSYEYTDNSNATNTKITVSKVYHSGTSEITTDKEYLIVALYDGNTFLNSTLVNKSTAAVFPVTAFNKVKVNNITAGVYSPAGCTSDFDCLPCYSCIGGQCVYVGCGGGVEEREGSLSLYASSSGYVCDPVEFHVQSGREDIEGATVRISYEDVAGYIDSGTTNRDGIYTSSYIDPRRYEAYARKSGYEDSAKRVFSLSLKQMSASYPNYIYVDSQLEFIISDAVAGEPLPGASARLYSPTGREISSCTTGMNGDCTFGPHLFSSPGEYSIVLNKACYGERIEQFRVSLYPLDVYYPSSVYTKEKFNIEVRSLGQSLQGADVDFDAFSLRTDDKGMVYDIMFEHPGSYAFTVSKDKHQAYSGSVRVSYPPMYPLYPEEMFAKESFVLGVTSPSEDCIADVLVRIGDNEFYTNETGEADIYIAHQNNYTITLSKENCSEFRDVIEIPERPPEDIYEDIKVPDKKVEPSLVSSIAAGLGLSGLIKSGCEGIYVEGIPTVFCDFVWLIVAAGAVASALLRNTNFERMLYGFAPVLAAIAIVPAAGAVVGIASVALSYRAWVAGRALQAAQMEEAEEIKRKIVEEEGEFRGDEGSADEGTPIEEEQDAGEEMEDIEEEPVVPGEDEHPPFGPGGGAPPEKPPSSQGRRARARGAHGRGARRGTKRRR